MAILNANTIKRENPLLENNRPLLIVCNGPSSSDIDYRRLPENPIIFRMNFFSLEKHYYYSRRVDALFFAVYQEALIQEISKVIEKHEYDINKICYPREILKDNNCGNILADSKLITSHCDHWDIISSKPQMSRLMMSRPLPTQGLQALATGLILGFEEIYIIGMDFYQSNDRRYAYEVPEHIKQNLAPQHLKPGYEQKAHSFNKDQQFFKLMLKNFPNAKVYSLSEMSYLSRLTDLAPIRETAYNIYSEKKLDNETDQNRKYDCKSNASKKIAAKLISLADFLIAATFRIPFIKKILMSMQKRL